jgi:hypothetical protein
MVDQFGSPSIYAFEQLRQYAHHGERPKAVCTGKNPNKLVDEAFGFGT